MDKLRPYAFHGLQLSAPKNGECMAECPFCGRSNKFSVNETTGQWRCWVCAEGTTRGGGNIYTFIRKYHELCLACTKPQDYEELVEDRGYLSIQPLLDWQVCRSVITGNWLIPGYNPSAQLTSLYQQFTDSQGARTLRPTPTLGHHIHGMNLWDSRKPAVYICEGPWDGMALWELLVQAKNTTEGLRATASREYSLAAQANVIAVPGAETFFESWLQIFEDKIVNLMFDSDHPRKHPKTGHITEGAGWRGMQRITRLFVEGNHKPQELNCLVWGEEGHDPTRKSGFDIRDYLTKD